ncbi:hypothetical protein D7X55_06110 [Corallococcus sp. AB049A]|uniref:DUF5953 family protein n=1 Tax=Corallococcus sp. AB049A TaxID=2316721 RepID=UPI000EC12F7B|nr:DUF5953 family protein [Corallococcus sp. AB049A]RKI73115.1 hypothetical protein D7X55_06110 [Corallococcus sp. AB049A]
MEDGFTFVFVAHAPALVPGDERGVLAVRAMEQVFPALNLSWTSGDEGQFVPVTQRDAWIARELRAGGITLLCNGDDAFLETLNSYSDLRPLDESASQRPHYEVHAEWPVEPPGLSVARPVLAVVSEAVRAFWAHVTPNHAAMDIGMQRSPRAGVTGNPRRGLPLLKHPDKLRAPEVPYHLGWLNYWSDATARLLGFPDATRDAELLTRSRRTTSGGWLVQLTDTPLDLDAPAHLDTLLRAYARFPGIGGRVP